MSYSTRERPTYTFTVRVEESDWRYAHCYVTIRSQNHDELVVFTWQAHELSADEDRTIGVEGEPPYKEGWSHWYGFGMELRTSRMSHLADCYKVVKGIMRKWENWFQPSAIVMINHLIAKRNIHEATWDNRLHEYIPLAEIQDTRLSRWGEDHRALGETWLTTSVLAKDEEDARQKLTVKMAEKHHDKLLAKFLEHGKPVRELDRAEIDPRPGLVKIGAQEPAAEQAPMDW
jgi:hypothetical protein